MSSDLLNINIYKLMPIIVVTVFMWSFGIDAGAITIPFSLVFVYILFIAFLFLKPQYIIRNIIYLYKKTPFKYIIYFIIWAIVSFSIFSGNPSKISYVVFRVIRDYFLFIAPIIISAAVIVPKYISFKKLLRYFIFLSFFITIYGIIKYIISNINPELHLMLHHIFAKSIITNDQVGRASSIFFEPSFYATFLFVYIPVYLYIANNKIQIFKGRIKNRVFTTLLLFLVYTNLFLTASPIYIILAFLYSFLFYLKTGIQKLKGKIIIIVLGIFIVLFSFIGLISLSENIKFTENKIVSRIVKVAASFKSLDSLIEAEPSLGTRLSLSVNTFLITMQHPIVGYGYANTKDIMYKQLINSPIAVTYEIVNENNRIEGLTVANILFQHFSWTGIIGVLLIYAFFIRTIILAVKYSKYYDPETKKIIDVFILAAINYIICSFYWLLITDISMWFVFGLLNSVTMNYNNKYCIIKSIPESRKGKL